MKGGSEQARERPARRRAWRSSPGSLTRIRAAAAAGGADVLRLRSGGERDRRPGRRRGLQRRCGRRLRRAQDPRVGTFDAGAAGREGRRGGPGGDWSGPPHPGPDKSFGPLEWATRTGHGVGVAAVGRLPPALPPRVWLPGGGGGGSGAAGHGRRLPAPPRAVRPAPRLPQAVRVKAAV